MATTWRQFAGELIGQGRDNSENALVENPALAQKIVVAIMA